MVPPSIADQSAGAAKRLNTAGLETAFPLTAAAPAERDSMLIAPLNLQDFRAKLGRLRIAQREMDGAKRRLHSLAQLGSDGRLAANLATLRARVHRGSGAGHPTNSAFSRSARRPASFNISPNSLAVGSSSACTLAIRAFHSQFRCSCGKAIDTACRVVSRAVR